jgi:hypothetical protein
LDLLRQAWRLGLVSGRGPFVAFGRTYATTEDLAAGLDGDRLTVLVAEAEHARVQGMHACMLCREFGMTLAEVDEFWTFTIAKAASEGFVIRSRSEALLASWQRAGSLAEHVHAWRDQVATDRAREREHREQALLVAEHGRRLAQRAALRVAWVHPTDPDLSGAVLDGSVTEVDAMRRHEVTADNVVAAYDQLGGHPLDWSALPGPVSVRWLAGRVAVFDGEVPVAAWDRDSRLSGDTHERVPVPQVEPLTVVVGAVEAYDDEGLAERFAAEHPGTPVEVVEGLRSGLYSEGEALLQIEPEEDQT